MREPSPSTHYIPGAGWALSGLGDGRDGNGKLVVESADPGSAPQRELASPPVDAISLGRGLPIKHLHTANCGAMPGWRPPRRAARIQVYSFTGTLQRRMSCAARSRKMREG